jgi:hypothetical protein
MIIRGKERHFEFNVQSHDEISRICRDNDIANMAELYENSVDTVHNIIRIAVILNRGYEDHKAYDDPDYKPEYLTEDDFKFMLYPDIRKLEGILNTVMAEGRETEIETAPVIDKSSKNGEPAEA